LSLKPDAQSASSIIKQVSFRGNSTGFHASYAVLTREFSGFARM
jgi:hypothetical protein